MGHDFMHNAHVPIAPAVRYPFSLLIDMFISFDTSRSFVVNKYQLHKGTQIIL